MSGTAPKSELLRSLGRLVRGLSALFWGLPLTLILYVQTARMDWLGFLGPYGILPPMIASAMLVFGLHQMAQFQKQERIWRLALDRAMLLAWINTGLSPFLYWWHKVPGVPLYSLSVAILALSSLLLLFNLNQVLHRLTAMLPDETLRAETALFTSFNRSVLLSIPILLALYFALVPVKELPRFLIFILSYAGTYGLWLILFLILMPMAMTMALIWKIKEAIFSSVFDADA